MTVGARTEFDLPLCARFALWFDAWADGRCSLDDARDAIVAGDAAHDVVGLPDEPEPMPLILALGRLGSATTRAGIALPVPGDPLGLAGPPDFNADAVEAREAVILDAGDVGLVPTRVGSGVTWRHHVATSRRQAPTRPEADSGLRLALLRATETLARLDVAGWRPEVADELVANRDEPGPALPPGTDPRDVRLLGLAVRCRRVVALALGDDGGALTAAQVQARRDALRPLDRAARGALVAASASRPR